MAYNLNITEHARGVGVVRINVDDIVVDYIASMTDDYFLDLFVHEFPDDELCTKIHYTQYFE